MIPWNLKIPNGICKPTLVLDQYTCQQPFLPNAMSCSETTTAPLDHRLSGARPLQTLPQQAPWPRPAARLGPARPPFVRSPIKEDVWRGSRAYKKTAAQAPQTAQAPSLACAESSRAEVWV